jgi:hypothetical protein
MTLTVLPGTTVVALLTTLDDIANKLNTARSGASSTSSPSICAGPMKLEFA